MKILMDKLIFSLFLIILSFTAINVHAADTNYSIENYNIDIKVNENNTFDITEIIDVNFNKKQHGVIRKIPLGNRVERTDGTKSENKAKITNVSVDSKYKTYKYDGYYNIKIGDSSKEIIGKQRYVIKYTYNIGKDPINNADELYFNIIGTEWDSTIYNVNFKITMPKEFDSSKINFYVGEYRETNGGSLAYKVNDKVISGQYSWVLSPNEGITMRITLPNGYFTSSSVLSIIDYLQFIIPAILVVIFIYIWLLHGKDDKPIETVEFYPPYNLNSLDLAYQFKGSVNKKDVISLLIYLANKGYIKIEETNLNFSLIKLKDYNENNEIEKYFLDELFKEKYVVTNDDLKDKFFRVVNRIIDKNKNKNKNVIYEKINKSYLLISMIMIIIISYLTLIMPMIQSFGASKLSIINYFLLIGSFILLVIVPYIKQYAELSYYSKTFIYPAVTFMALISSISFFKVIINTTLFNKIVIVFGFICISILIVFNFLMQKRNTYGIDILGKIKGFKNFLETANKEQLEMQVAKNPMYFYDILPYTYVLGVSSTWISKFEEIATMPPSWYVSSNDFNANNIGSRINETISSAIKTMSSSPSSSSSSYGGSSSGGGFSGGGSAGGGGTSW